MTDSIIDELEIIQTVDDDIDCGCIKPSMEIQDKVSCSDDIDENTNLKISCQTKPSILMSSSLSHKSTFTRNSFPSRKYIKLPSNDRYRQSGPNTKDLKKLNNNDQFTCESCSHKFDPLCEICCGKTKLNGNDKLVKFFEFVLEFKLGKQQIYKPKQQKLLSKRNHPNEHCNIYYSAIHPKPYAQEKSEPKVRFSISNDSCRPISNVQHDDRLKCQDTHFGYVCDRCQIDPIEGVRYHCDYCGNFDMCEQCYHQYGHEHALSSIQLKTNKKTFEKINHLLKASNSSGLRSSIRNSSALQSSLVNKTCRSWIR